MDNRDEQLKALFAARKAQSTSKSAYQLDLTTMAQIERFGTFLTNVENKTYDTMCSYKSYMRKVLALDIPYDKCTSDQKSAIGAFERFVTYEAPESN